MDDLTYIYSLIPEPTESLEPAWVPSVKGYREDSVFEAVEACGKNQIYILGGDIYCHYSGGICNTGDNWYTNPSYGESFHDIAERSYTKTIDYLNLILDPRKTNNDRPYLIRMSLMSKRRKYFLPCFNLPSKALGVPGPTENLVTKFDESDVKKLGLRSELLRIKEKIGSNFKDLPFKGYTEVLAMEAIDNCEQLSVVVEGGHIHSYRYGKLHAEGEYWN